MHQSFVKTASSSHHLLGWAVDSGANVQGSDLSSSHAAPGKCRTYDITQYTPGEFTIIKSRAILSVGPRSAGLNNRAVMDENLSSPLFPVGGVRCSGYR